MGHVNMGLVENRVPPKRNWWLTTIFLTKSAVPDIFGTPDQSQCQDAGGPAGWFWMAWWRGDHLIVEEMAVENSNFQWEHSTDRSKLSLNMLLQMDVHIPFSSPWNLEQLPTSYWFHGNSRTKDPVFIAGDRSICSPILWVSVPRL